MKPKILAVAAALVAALTASSCGNAEFLSSSRVSRLWRSLPTMGANRSDGLYSAESPSGSDALSASTNHSSTEEILQPKLDGLAGTAFIKPPQINNYGTVNLAYPMETAPGRAGMQPSLGLSYSSSGGDGLAGMGWSLATGLGVISRATSHGQLYYDYRDTFTFNGRRLVKVSGPARSENGVYRLEIESGFSRFELTDAETGGLWHVYDKAGTVTIYGENRESRVFHPDDRDRTYLWQFTRSIDLNGNYFFAVYDDDEYRDTNIRCLKEIRYTGNIRENTTARQYVRFSYRKRRDAYVSKAAGFVMTMDRLLDEVTVGWDNPGGLWSSTLWTYRMVYDTSDDSGRPLLVTVDSSRTTTQPRFNYQEAKHYFSWRNVANPRAADSESNPDATQYFEGDFNGDGLSDMVFFNPDTGDWSAAEALPDGGYAHKQYGNRFRGYMGADKIQWFKGGATGDFNGDGRSDIAFYLTESRELWVAEHNGRTFDFRLYGTLPNRWDIFKCEWFTGDFDGNGLSDAVLFNEAAGQWTFMRNLGGRFEFIQFSTQFKNLFREDYRPDGAHNSVSTADVSPFGANREKVQFLCGDFNGDGRTDISIYDARSGQWWVGENIRKDQAAGFTLQWYLYRQFRAPEQALFANDRFTGDFNGDGFSDFLLLDRVTGEWWLGETGNRTINFRLFSEMPRGKDITRWLQGDFNGDGRTDIGFYSSADGNFWIGEATPSGFRYRAYTNLRNCPDPQRILGRAPLPRDEVIIADARAIITTASSTQPLAYQFDGNYHQNCGEQAFGGYFTGGGVPELIIYNRAQQAFSLKQGSGSPATVLAADLGAEGTRFLGDGKTVRYRSTDGVAWYQPEGSLFGSRRHNMFIAYHKSSSMVKELMAGFADGDGTNGTIADFNIGTSRYWIDRFDADSGDARVLVLNDGAANPTFVLFNAAGQPQTIAIDGTTLDSEYFRGLRSRQVRIFSGFFTAGSRASLLLVDYSGPVHRWYLGTLSSASVSFRELTGNPRFYADGFVAARAVEQGPSANLVYGSAPNGLTAFHVLRVESDRISLMRDYVMSEGVQFTGEFDHEDRPVVSADGVWRRVVLDQGYRLESLTAEYRMERPDLKTAVYPFRWIQGDYNGDGKTDIGFFHLKEGTWYFALTQGTVPDIMERVQNGIGGSYLFEYVNSSGFDNDGDDGLPHLPMNYRVCSKLTIADGHGQSYVTRYEYAGGYAFSAFIDGCKETDYFGFGEFTVIDAYGAKSVSRYNNVPYDDFRKNRALAGAMKETRHIGSDHVEYGRAEYDYAIHEISESMAQQPSYLIEPTAVRQYRKGTLAETRTSTMTLADGRYELKSKTESFTDHYADGVHKAATLTTVSDFDTIEATNEMRLSRKILLTGTPNETTTRFHYDDRGNLTSQRSSYTGSGIAPAADRVMTYAYDALGNRVRESNESGIPARIVERRYDDMLRQFMVEERIQGDGVILTSGYEVAYGPAFGAISRKRDPNGNSVYFSYDEYGRLSEERVDIDGAVATTTQYQYSTDFPCSGKVTRHTGTGSPIETRVFLDGMGRPLHSVRSATGESGMRYVKSGPVVYDRAGRVIRVSQSSFVRDEEIEHFRDAATEKNPTITEYDGAGRVARVTSPRAYDGEPDTTTTMSYNDPWEVVESHSVGRSKRTVMNARGQVLYVEDNGRGDDGKNVNARIGFAYDAAGNRVKKMDLNGAAMTLDVPGSLFTAGIKDTSGNNIACWRYNGFGQVTETSDPDLGYAAVRYTPFGEAASRTDALGRTTEFTYDRLGRLTEKLLPGSEGAVRYTYDRAEGGENALGRIVSVEDPVQVKQFSYDTIGRVKEERRRIRTAPNGGLPANEQAYVTRYRHDLVGRKRSIEYPANERSGARFTVYYEHCAMGVTSVRADNGAVGKDLVRSVTYNERGQMAVMTRGNGTVSSYDYDNKGRLAHLVTTASHNSASWKVQDITYNYKTDNSIVSIENRPTVAADAAVQSTIQYDYQYDGLNRLVHASGMYEKTRGAVSSTGVPGEPSPPAPLPGGEGSTAVLKFARSYRYAANGNMTGKVIRDPDTGSVLDDWTYTYQNHAVTKIVTTAGGTRFQMGYDDAGNMTQQQDSVKGLTKKMGYDSNNRITAVRDASNAMIGQYDYDDQGYRVRKLTRINSTQTGGTEKYKETLSPSMYMTTERDKNADGTEVPGTAQTINHVYLNGIRIAALNEGCGAVYYLTDQVDSVNVVLNDSGLIVSQVEFLPFGETWTHEGDTGHSPKYGSQELDKETNYYFYNARHYDPEICRFVTADTVIPYENETQSWNRFSYVRNNPIVYKDPTGHVEAFTTCSANGMEYHREYSPSGGGKGNNVAPQAQTSARAQAPEAKQGTSQNNIARNMQSAKGPLDRLGEAAQRNPDTVLAVSLSTCLGMPYAYPAYNGIEQLGGAVNSARKRIEDAAVRHVQNYTGEDFYRYARRLHQTSSTGTLRELPIQHNVHGEYPTITGRNEEEMSEKEKNVSLMLNGERSIPMQILDRTIIHWTAVVHDERVITHGINPTDIKPMLQCFVVGTIVGIYNLQHSSEDLKFHKLTR